MQATFSYTTLRHARPRQMNSPRYVAVVVGTSGIDTHWCGSRNIKEIVDVRRENVEGLCLQHSETACACTEYGADSGQGTWMVHAWVSRANLATMILHTLVYPCAATGSA